MYAATICYYAAHKVDRDDAGRIEWDKFKIARPFTVQELQDLTDSLPDGIPDFLIELDGVALQNVQLLHFTSPEFSFTLPQNNLFQGLGSAVSTPGTYFPTVAEGFYVMLRPLSVGEHTLRIHSKNLPGALDITYYLTVVSLILP